MGTQKYWDNGLPFAGIQNTASDEGTQKYWSDGLPGTSVFTAGVSPPEEGQPLPPPQIIIW